MLTRRCGDPYPKGAAEAILLSLRAVEDADESGLTTRVLAAIAVVAPTGVHRAVLLQILQVGGGDAAGPVARAWRSALRVVSARTTRPTPTTTIPASVEEALARLVGLSLLGWGSSGTSVILHRLVGRVVRDRQQTAGRLASTIVDTVAALWSLRIPDDQAWARQEQGAELVAHAVAVWDIALDHTGDDRLTPDQLTRCADLANWAVRHLTVTADLSRATRIGAQVLGDCERVLGPDHPNTLTSRNNLAGAYESAGRLGEAIPLYEATLTERERVLGPDHPNTRTVRDNLRRIQEK